MKMRSIKTKKPLAEIKIVKKVRFCLLEKDAICRYREKAGKNTLKRTNPLISLKQIF